jgi:hypothetical protein
VDEAVEGASQLLTKDVVNRPQASGEAFYLSLYSLGRRLGQESLDPPPHASRVTKEK